MNPDTNKITDRMREIMQSGSLERSNLAIYENEMRDMLIRYRAADGSQAQAYVAISKLKEELGQYCAMDEVVEDFLSDILNVIWGFCPPAKAVWPDVMQQKDLDGL